ncbi:hypothetical protein [Flagellimonas sp.]|uniref:hypothetical protein n=1 Tax=Flagellimonas sp. TaxID=2058762 RepID=UPI003BAA7F9B
MNSKNVSIQLTKEEAIVLFEFLGRFNEIDDSSRFEDQSEQRVLWDIECILEKELSEPFQADYLEIVNNAREAVRDENE